jgi:hypothetical protein
VWEDETRKQKGQFANERKAAEAYDDYCAEHDLGWPLNFPARYGLAYTAVPFPNEHNPKKRKQELVVAGRGSSGRPRKKKKKSRKRNVDYAASS